MIRSLLVLSVAATFFLSSTFASERTSSKNWVSIYVWDAFSPLIFDQSVPVMLTSLEVIFQQHISYQAQLLLNPAKKFEKKYGTRSTEGHYMMWLHMSDDLLKKYGLARSVVEDHLWVHSKKETDIFTGWSGEANFKAFMLHGVSGLAETVVLPDGTRTGNFQGFKDARPIGNSDFAGGFYITDEQVVKILESIRDYDGRKYGYNFMRRIEDRPNAPYEPQNAQGTNGYNCIDFVYTALDHAGILPKAISETFKVDMVYPENYWSDTIPLSGTGKKVYKKFAQNPDQYMSRGDILGMGWMELLFSGIDIFDERTIMDRVIHERMPHRSVRIWDQTASIPKLAARVDFQSKRLVDELAPIFDEGGSFTSPESVGMNPYDFRKTKRGYGFALGSAKRLAKKLQKADLEGNNLTLYQEFEKSLRH